MNTVSAWLGCRSAYCCSVPLLNAVPLKLWTVHSKLWNYCTVNKFNLWRYCLARCDEIFDHFTLLDETLRHSELCNSVISQIQLHKSAKTCLTVWTVHTEQFWRRISSPPFPNIQLIYFCNGREKLLSVVSAIAVYILLWRKILLQTICW